jgi:hypothetical protein
MQGATLRVHAGCGSFVFEVKEPLFNGIDEGCRAHPSQMWGISSVQRDRMANALPRLPVSEHTSSSLSFGSMSNNELALLLVLQDGLGVRR